MAEHDPSGGRSASPAAGDLSLPKPPGVIRRFWARHPWLTDSLIAAAYTVPAFFGVLTAAIVNPRFPDVLLAPALIVVCGSGAALLFRRRAPLLVLGILLACMVATFWQQATFNEIPVCLALYAVAVYRSNRAAWIGLGASALVLLGAALIPWPAGMRVVDATHPEIVYAVLMLVAVLIGANVGNRKRYLEALIDRAAQLARERDQQARLAAAAERTRIARELHDIVSHSLTVMVSLAEGSVAAAERAPQRSAAAMERVAETGRGALAEMRRMLGVLHDDTDPDGPTELAPQPGAGDLLALVETFRAAGLPVRFSSSGEPIEDSGLELAVYRIVQESLTNALRYATGATQVTAAVAVTDEAVTVRVTDDGRGAGDRQGAGRGLVGMRERVAVHGGTVAAGAGPAGGWNVTADLPRSSNRRQKEDE